MNVNLDYRDYREEESVASLLSRLRDESLELFRQEAALARRELEQKASQIMRSTIYLAAGGAILYAGIVFLLLAASDYLQLALFSMGTGVETAVWLGPLIVGAAAAFIGAVLVWLAASRMRRQLSDSAVISTGIPARVKTQATS